MGSFCPVERFTSGSGHSFKGVRKPNMMSEQVLKWLRQQSKDFYVAGLDALVKRWDKCIYVGGGFVEKQMFCSSSSITYFTFYIHLWPIHRPFLVSVYKTVGLRTIKGQIFGILALGYTIRLQICITTIDPEIIVNKIIFSFTIYLFYIC
jgi:hypothetical protein